MIAIIGSGPAGVSCALYIARANIPVIVFTNHKSSLLKSKAIENYYGTGKISGEELYYQGIEDLKKLNVPIYEEELKYFYANYKDYYYLPTEDVALHKSIASFVDKDYRIQACASNCYTRKISRFLPQWKILMEPFFKREYKSKDLFFELTDDIKKNRELFSIYASHILNEMALQQE